MIALPRPNPVSDSPALLARDDRRQTTDGSRRRDGTDVELGPGARASLTRPIELIRQLRLRFNSGVYAELRNIGCSSGLPHKPAMGRGRG